MRIERFKVSLQKKVSLLSSDEAADAVKTVNLDGTAPIVLVCDHASNRVPASLGLLGLSPDVLDDHVGWDIGARDVTCALSELLDAPAVVAGFSRLVVDCNRYPWDPESIPRRVDGYEIPRNNHVSWVERQRRIEEVFLPYHAACQEVLRGRMERDRAPLFVSVHSMTPRLRDGGALRPWELSVCWTETSELTAPLIGELRAQSVNVGDNQPYSLDVGIDFSTCEHAMRHGLPHLQLEFRQDLISTPDQAFRWAKVLYQALSKVLADHPKIRTRPWPFLPVLSESSAAI
jgi:predicted N-formylglutamate amidohydrolase